METNPTIVIWIQNVPGIHGSVLSRNGRAMAQGSTEYIKNFELVTKLGLDDSRALTPTVRRFTNKVNPLTKKRNPRMTFLSGNFTQTDEYERLVCYRALIKGAKDTEEELSLLEHEANLYGCSISDSDRDALKKKDMNKIIFILIYFLVIIFIAALVVWI